MGDGDADADHLDLGHALSPSRSRSAEGNGVFYSDDGRQYGMRAILARATAGHYEACAAVSRTPLPRLWLRARACRRARMPMRVCGGVLCACLRVVQVAGPRRGAWHGCL